MLKSLSFALVLSAALAAPAIAGQATANQSVQITVDGGCQIVTPPEATLSDTLVAGARGGSLSSNMAVLCSNGLPYAVEVDGTASGNGTFSLTNASSATGDQLPAAVLLSDGVTPLGTSAGGYQWARTGTGVTDNLTWLVNYGNQAQASFDKALESGVYAADLTYQINW
jgi:hypothetical protein